MFVDRPVGIDLGTTNSEIALLDPSEARLLLYADRFGRKTIPSAVAWDEKTNALLVGHPARARRGRTPAPIESIKRKMGQREKVALGPDMLFPEEVSAKILGELAARMREHLATQAREGVTMKVTRGVITVPAYFDAPQVEATRKAGEIAGLDVIGVLQEPTAAAIYHTYKSKLGDGHFLVYDLGGGTFDVSILRCVGGEYQVLAIDGDNYLGGDDLDRKYAEHLRQELVKRGYALDLDVRHDAADRARFSRIVHLAQEIKESLSTSDVVHVSKENVLEDKHGEPVSFDADVGRADYEAVIGSLVETTLVCCERALARAKEVAHVGIEEIDHVVLVGGSTRVPMVIRRVTETLCKKSRAKEPLQDEVDTCVALGAAIHAAQIGGLRLGEGQGDGAAAVDFTTPLVGTGTTLKLGLRVLAAPSGTRALALRSSEGDAVRTAVDAIPSSVLRLTVKLADAAESPTTLTLEDGAGKTLSEIPLALYRGDVRPRASELSRASVVAKDIALEVLRAGRRERKVLLARGTGLPAEAEYRFFTVDQSGAVVLRLLQERLPIKSLVLEVDKSLPLGTPVDLKIKCDETMRLEARALVAGRELWAQIEAAETARFDAGQDVEALLEEAERAGIGLWGSYGNAYRKEADRLMVGIREVMATDPDKLHALCHRLRLLVDDFRGAPGEELSPPMHTFEDALDALRRVFYRAAGGLVGMSREEWETRIQDIDRRAHTAYEASDASGWRRVHDEVQALLETARQEEFAAVRIDDPAYLGLRVKNLVAWCNRVERSLVDFVPAAGDVRAMQEAERDRLLSWLREKAATPLVKIPEQVPADAHELRRTLDQIGTEIERIEGGLERIPSIGLVTDRGAS